MASTSEPLNIARPRLSPGDAVSNSFTTPIGTPDLRALRSQYAAGTSPPPNIPPRAGSAVPTPETESPRPPRMTRPGSPSSDVNALDLDDLPDEEKAKVLRRHLVSRDERMNRPVANSLPGSDAEVTQAPDQEISRKSSMQGLHPHREDTEPFPVPYHTPGADVT
jgi:proton-coupled amino acid transporter